MNPSKKQQHVTMWCLVFCALVGWNIASMIFGVFPLLIMARGLRQQVVPQEISSQHPISVVIMNHHRPQVLRDSNLLPIVSHHPNVGEVLLLHSNPDTAFAADYLPSTVDASQISHQNATEFNSQFGLAVRFHYCAEATHDWVLIVDDDMELESIAIDRILAAFAQDSHRIVGRYGRTIGSQGQYILKNSYGNVEIVLTKFLLVERSVCNAFNRYRYLLDDSAQHSVPKWNGEDIFLNLVANKLYGVPSTGPYKNFAMRDLPVWDSRIPTDFEASVSGNPINFSFDILANVQQWRKRQARARLHREQRTKIYTNGKERLAQLEDGLVLEAQ